MEENKKVIMEEDLPSGLWHLKRMFWEPEEASAMERGLPEVEQVEAFLQWCRDKDNFNWEGKYNQETKKWLIENGYTPIE